MATIWLVGALCNLILGQNMFSNVGFDMPPSLSPGSYFAPVSFLPEWKIKLSHSMYKVA